MIKYENVEKALKIISNAISSINDDKEISLIDATIATVYMGKLLLKSLEVCNVLPKDKVDAIEKNIVENLKAEDMKQIIEKYMIKQKGEEVKKE